MNNIVSAPLDRLFPLNEAMAFIGFRSRTSIYKLIEARELSPVRRGRSFLFRESDLAQYIQRLAAQRESV